MSNFLDEVLDAAYTVDEMEKRPSQDRVASPRQQQMMQRANMTVASTPDAIDNLLGEMENSIHGPSVQTQIQGYDPQAEMERIQKRQTSGVSQGYVQRSGMPRAIVESIMANPCDLDPSLVMEASDPRRAELDSKLMAKFGNGSDSNPFDRVQEINNILDESDAQNEPANKPQPQTVVPGGVANVDYALIKTIVSAVLDEKLETIKKALLTESVHPMPNLANIKAVSMKDKILFVDSSDNVYECTFTHKGKNRRKK